MNLLPFCYTIERRDALTLDDEDSWVTGTITLDETDRHRRRVAMTSDQGLAFILTLENTTLLRHGDHLVLDDRRRVIVQAAPEHLYEIRANDDDHLLRLAWHVGNRHLPTQVMSDHLRIRRDPVIRTMLEGLGAEVRDVEAGFDPEGGAYDAVDHHAGQDLPGESPAPRDPLVEAHRDERKSSAAPAPTSERTDLPRR